MTIKLTSMRTLNILWIGLIAIIVNACSSGVKNITTSSTGRNGEILIVTDRDLWRGDLKDTITNYFTAFQDGLPQAEPKFSIFQTPTDEFNRILRPHRSILIISLDNSSPEAKITITKDKWAEPQVVIKLIGPTRELLVKKFWQERDNIANLFIESEYRRYQKVALSMGEPGITKTLEEKYGFSLDFPQGFSISSQLPNFCWIRKEAKDFSNGVLIYTYDYTNENSLSPKNILFIRDSITKAYISGPTDSSFMAVSYSDYQPKSIENPFNGNYCIETRGLWLVKNDFMGGPFVNYTFVDKERNKVIVLDAYVYAPRDNKRDMLRSVEAILHTWKSVSKAVVKK